MSHREVSQSAAFLTNPLVLHPGQGEPDQREWLLTNGLGSLSSGTICDAHTRTYHGLLMAALDPPLRRTLLLSRLEAILETEGEVIELSTNFWGSGVTSPLGFEVLDSFSLDPVPTWTWAGQTATGLPWRLTRRILMPHDDPEERQGPLLSSCTLIEYRYQGERPANLMLRLLIADRDLHQQQRSEPGLFFRQTIQGQQVLFQSYRLQTPGTPWVLRWSKGRYTADGFWYWKLHYPRETERGLRDQEDLYSPGYLSVRLVPDEALTLEAVAPVAARATPEAWLLSGELPNFEQMLAREAARLEEIFGDLPLWQDCTGRTLLKASDQFLVYRRSVEGPTMIAGYPWFEDWGRHMLVSLPGLTLSTGRYPLARQLLRTCALYCQDGIVPNFLSVSDGEPSYNSIDASLWWLEALGLYLSQTQDWEFLAEQFATVRQILKGYMLGTRYGIHTDPADQLVSWDAPGEAITWMDAVVDGKAITPRMGKPVEINALWYSALCWATDWATHLDNSSLATQYSRRAEQARASMQRFWNPDSGYLYDRLGFDGTPDATIRPNAILALSLHHCAFEGVQARRVLALARSRLLTPMGLRSLDPQHPAYVGHYRGGPKQRDSIYHQGTVWSWLIGPFARAWQRFYPEAPLPVDLKPLLAHLTQEACLGSISEIFDGDDPHTAQGTVAQAWSVAELLRLLLAK